MHGHPNLMHLLIFACGIMDLIPLIACNTTALIPIEGIGAQRKGSVVSGSVKDAIMGFKNFNSSDTMIRSEGYL